MTDPKHAHDTDHGTPTKHGRPKGPTVPPKTRFERFVDKATNGCWTWIGKSSRDGYGRFFHKSRWQMAHRAAHELFVGPIPTGFEVDHLCHNADATCAGGPACPHRLCVNPSHLEAVTHKTNMRRTEYIGSKARQTHCKHGHEFDDANTARDSRGTRRCRACDRDKKAALRAQRKAVAA